MASIYRSGGKWRAGVCVHGIRKSRRFNTKGRARAWAEQLEDAMRDGVISTDATLSDALDRYAREVSPQHKGERWEIVRIKALKRLPVSSKRITDVTPSDIAEWRDRRLQDVSGGTVRREMGLLRSVFDIARREWMWIQKNPMDDVRKPPAPPSRDRIIQDDEIALLSDQLTGQYRTIFLLALETGMRCGEICGIQAQDVHGKYVTLRNTKNGSARNVPLTPTARELIQDAPFSTTSANMSAVFYKAKTALNLDCTFHDARHTACTRLAKKIPALTLARMMGHNSLKTTLLYYNESADDIADSLG